MRDSGDVTTSTPKQIRSTETWDALGAECSPIRIATVDAAKKYAEERIEWFVRTDTARHYED